MRLDVRGKFVTIRKHAYEGAMADGISEDDILEVLENAPYHARTRLARARLRGRTVTVYYDEDESEIEVRGVSATTRKLGP